MEYSMKDVLRIVTTAGLVIAIAFVGSALVFANSHYHTSQREGSWGVTASSWLELFWATVGSVLAVTCWRATTRLFRIVLVLNIAIASFLIAEFIWLR
jgi:hypothetical protein